jgi:hypothetical protein
MLSYNHHVVFSGKCNASTFCIPALVLACHFMWSRIICAVVTTHSNRIVIACSYSPQMVPFHRTSQGHKHNPFSYNTTSSFSLFNENSSSSWSASEYECTKRLRNWNGNMVCHILTAQMLIAEMSTLILLLTNITTYIVPCLGRNSCQREYIKHKKELP